MDPHFGIVDPDPDPRIHLLRIVDPDLSTYSFKLNDLGPFGSHLGPFGYHLVSFGNHLGLFGYHLVSFGNHLGPFGIYLGPFGINLGPFGRIQIHAF